MINLFSSDYNLHYSLMRKMYCAYCHKFILRYMKRLDCIDEYNHEVTYHKKCYFRALNEA